MTGPEHYLAAEGILNDALKLAGDGAEMSELIAVAQVHATLAMAAATADPFDHQPEWAKVTR